MKTFADKVLEFNEWLANVSLDLPEGYAVCNPFRGENQDQIKEITKLFYQKYYADNKKRFLILGSSPVFLLRMLLIFIKKQVFKLSIFM